MGLNTLCFGHKSTTPSLSAKLWKMDGELTEWKQTSLERPTERMNTLMSKVVVIGTKYGSQTLAPFYFLCYGDK